MFRRIKKLGGTKKWMLDEPSTVVDLNQGQYSIKKKKRKEKVLMLLKTRSIQCLFCGKGEHYQRYCSGKLGGVFGK